MSGLAAKDALLFCASRTTSGKKPRKTTNGQGRIHITARSRKKKLLGYAESFKIVREVAKPNRQAPSSPIRNLVVCCPEPPPRREAARRPCLACPCRAVLSEREDHRTQRLRYSSTTWSQRLSIARELSFTSHQLFFPYCYQITGALT